MRARFTPETVAILTCTLSNWAAHFCFILIPFLKLPQGAESVTPMTISLIAGVTWLIGLRARSVFALLFCTPILWGYNLIYCHRLLEQSASVTQDLIKLDAGSPETLGPLIPRLELSLYLLTLGAYLISTLLWLHISNTSKSPQWPQRLNRLEQMTLIPKAHRVSLPYFKSERLLVYWCCISPFALGFWGELTSPVAELDSLSERNLMISNSWLFYLISLSLGSAWVLLRSAPPALLYLHERHEWTPRDGWRRWAWVSIVLGIILITVSADT